MSEWQDIDSAPKDGRSFMVFVGSEARCGVKPHCYSPVSRDLNGGWWDDATGEQIEPISGATHWMPLPNPPEPK